MQWVAGKLTKPAFKQAFGYLQNAHPNSQLTQHIAELATADNPMAPSDDAPFDPVQGSQVAAHQQPGGPRSLRDRAMGSMQSRAKTYALGKALNTVWAQVMLPLTVVLWMIKLITTFIESRCVAAALAFKSASVHASDVQRVCRQIRSRPADKLLASKKPAAQGHMERANEAKKVMGPATSLATGGGGLHLIDLSKLNAVLSVDALAKTCTVQAGCTFRDLLRATTQSHLMPPVVPPYLDITVGGAVTGSAIGSSSWKYGAFVDSVAAMEVALASGEVVVATRDGEHASLFAALHSSYHTVGTIVSLTVDLIRAPRYLWMRYEQYHSLAHATQRMQALLQVKQPESNFTLEGLVFDPKNIVLCLSQGIDAIDTQQHKVIAIGHWWEMHYFAYLQQWSQRAGGRPMPAKHCIPLMDYLSRYEKGAFWQSAWLYALLPWPLRGNSFVSRLLIGWTEHEANVRAAIENSERHLAWERVRIVQDAQVPLHHLGPFLHWTCDAVRVAAPLWLCPVRGSTTDVLASNYVHHGSSSNSADDGFHYVNVGVYGRFDSESSAFDLQTAFLGQVYQAGGRTLLHAHNFHSTELWAKMYDRRAYEAVRKKYGAGDAYPTIYAKVTMPTHEQEALKEATDPAQEGQLMHAMMMEIVTRKLKFWVD